MNALHKPALALQRRVLALPQRRCFSLLPVVSTNNPLISTMLSSLHISHNVLGGDCWWLSVVLCTLAMKGFLVFPLAVHSNKLMKRRQDFMKDFKEQLTHLKWKTGMATKELFWSNKMANNVYNFNKRELRRRLILKYNCHFAKVPISNLFSAGLWLHMSFSLRHLTGRVPFINSTSEAFEPDLQSQGCLWFPNLLEPDQYLILPTVLLLANMANIKLASKPIGAVVEQTKLMKYLLNFSRFGTVVMFFVACQTPSLISLYWTTSALFGLSQNLLFRLPSFCKLVGVPYGSPTPSPPSLSSQSSASQEK